MRMPMKRSLSLHFLCIKLIMIVAIITSGVNLNSLCMMTKSSSIDEHSIASQKCTTENWRSNKFKGNCRYNSENEIKCNDTCKGEGAKKGYCVNGGWCNCFCPTG
ncbi:hypothetical protein HanHA300_Chr03g0111401 [Helianthus annuus]|nr:hypothetical protein HanHA300_Chr03g0111401 [Helianthus annuus]KAJ0609759.1 hypothetical protein HanHA89_Chr03g0123491 [Helianthus annuus]KAJ0775535.1 hypothetical protein HanOQP8_Chr03g0123921 [Helianthus annuus]